MADRDPGLLALGLLVEPVRRDLYDWVVAQGRPVGREESARALKITRALATFHLDRLAAAGLLESGYRRLSGRVGPGAGRPARVYWRADREFS
ncbi:MAG TPA: helix-turn-helix domain-containing protein, partial [Jiangellaceae bacterium]